MAILSFFVGLVIKLLCYFFSWDIICSPPELTCENSRRVNLIASRTELGQTIRIWAFCDQQGTTFENIDSENSPLVELLRDSSDICTSVNGTLEIAENSCAGALLELPTFRFNEGHIECLARFDEPDPRIEIDFCCPEEDSVAVVLGSIETNTNLFTLDALSVVSDDPPEFQGLGCEALLSPSGSKVECSFTRDRVFAMLFQF